MESVKHIIFNGDRRNVCFSFSLSAFASFLLSAFIDIFLKGTMKKGMTTTFLGLRIRLYTCFLWRNVFFSLLFFSPDAREREREREKAGHINKWRRYRARCCFFPSFYLCACRQTVRSLRKSMVRISARSFSFLLSGNVHIIAV